MANDIELLGTKSMKKMEAGDIAQMTDDIVDCINQQQDEIDELENLDQAMSQLMRTNQKRKEMTQQVRRKMMRAHQQLG